MGAMERWGESTLITVYMLQVGNVAEIFMTNTNEKTNGWRAPKMMGRKEKVVPDLNMAIFGIYVRFLGGRVGHISWRLLPGPLLSFTNLKLEFVSAEKFDNGLNRLLETLKREFI